MNTTRTRLRRGALTACAAALALLAAGCSKASETTQTGGCRADGEWPGRQQAAWLRGAVSFQTVRGAAASHERFSVVVGVPQRADVRRLCRPLTVQVEFWTLTATTTRTEMSSVMRHELSADGGRTRTVGFPGDLPTGRDGACTRVLAAVYSGEPLTERELPQVTPGALADEDTPVRFGTDRVGAYRLLPPPDPARCVPSRSTASPSPTRSSEWDPFHP